MSTAEDNKIYLNNFLGNTENAYDEGDNIWDNGSTGNYWDDYEGRDLLPPYGIGDTPYDIPPGLLHNKDRYPLMGPWPGMKSHQHSINSLFLRFRSFSKYDSNTQTTSRSVEFVFFFYKTHTKCYSNGVKNQSTDAGFCYKSLYSDFFCLN